MHHLLGMCSPLITCSSHRVTGTTCAIPKRTHNRDRSISSISSGKGLLRSSTNLSPPYETNLLMFNGKNIACIELGHSGHKKVRVCKYDDDGGLHLGVYSLLADLVGPTLHRGH